MKEAAKNAEYKCVDGITEITSITERHLRRLFKVIFIKVHDIGRKGYHHVIIDITNEVLKVHNELKTGVTKTWMVLKRENIICSHQDVDDVFKTLINEEKPAKPKEKLRCRYEVNKVDGVWHGDIHYLKYFFETKYLFALMDDKSRYIVEFDIFDTKDAMNVKNTFTKAILSKNRKPIAYWSDNGTENIAETVQTFLKMNNIYHIRTLPGNPQSNGKIERFWPKLEEILKGCEGWGSIELEIEKYINDYNNRIPHLGLKKDSRGIIPCPSDVYFDESLRAESLENTNVIIDNMGEVPLLHFVRNFLNAN